MIKNLNLTIEGGKTLLITGASGIGKSTLVNIIFRFYDPKSGNIYIDDQNIKDLKFSFRDKIAICAQNHLFFNDTILNNLRISNVDRYYKQDPIKDMIQTKDKIEEFIARNGDEPEEEIIELCKAFNMYDKIVNFEGKFNYVIGDNGSKLSGGERQRLNIIRTLLKPADIYIFDEPTNFLDVINEQLFFRKLEQLQSLNKTIIIISHHLSFSNYADKILCFKRTGEFEYGTKSELLSMKGKFSELIDSSGMDS